MTPCKLSFVCGKPWLSLESTELPTARYCGDCQKNVFMVKTEEQFKTASVLGRCVAIADDNNFIGLVGQADNMDWIKPLATQEIFLTALSPLDGTRLLALRGVFPKIFDSGENESLIQMGKFIYVGTFPPKETEDLISEIDQVAPELVTRVQMSDTPSDTTVLYPYPAFTTSRAQVVDGDLLNQQVDVIVNTWNRNIIPWWLLLPQGVSGAIKKNGGLSPFKEVGKFGAIPLGKAVLTGAGKLPHKAIIHIAGINMLWRASTYSITESVKSSIELVNQHKFKSVAFPIIGAGSGGFKESAALECMHEALATCRTEAKVLFVRFRPHP